MSISRLPSITPDGYLRDVEEDLFVCEKYGTPAIRGTMVVPLGLDDYLRGRLQDALKEISGNEDNNRQLQEIGRSGWARAGIHIFCPNWKEAGLEGDKAFVPIVVTSVRNAMYGVTNTVSGSRRPDQVLTTLKDISHSDDIEMGRLLLLPRAALSKQEVEDVIGRGELLLPKGKYEIVEGDQGDGIIELSLDDLRYVFCEENFLQDVQVKLLKLGKHHLEVGGLQTLDREQGIPAELQPKEFFVGGMSISIGPYTAVIDEKTTEKEVIHLAACVLDGVRTTGMRFPRQAEIFNTNDNAVKTKNLRVCIRIYHTGHYTRSAASKLITPQTMRDGVAFRHIASIEGKPENALIPLMKSVSANSRQPGAYALLIGPGRVKKVPWTGHAESQDERVIQASEPFVSGQECLAGEAIPDEALHFTKYLNLVGADHSQGKMIVSNTFQSESAQEDLYKMGIGIHVASSFNVEKGAYRRQPMGECLDGDGMPDVFFTSEDYAFFCRMERKGLKYILVMPEMSDVLHGGKIPQHIRVFYKGCWVCPEFIDELDKKNVFIAHFGSSQKHIDHKLEQGGHIERSLKLLKDTMPHPECLATIDGNGPGVMKLNACAAEKLGILRIGSGVDAREAANKQDPNLRSPAWVLFGPNDLGPREDFIQNRATFRVFNIGGIGTSGEIFNALTALKLLSRFPTPHFFVDPLHSELNEKHTWEPTKQQIELQIGKGVSHQWVLNCCHFLDSYEEAVKIMVAFMHDPARYWKKVGLTREQVYKALDKTIELYIRLGIDLPFFINKELLEKW